MSTRRRILVVSNLYPPHFIGGYELGCRDVVEALRGQGHEVCVLTSTTRLEGVAEDPRDSALRTLGRVAPRPGPISLRCAAQALRRDLRILRRVRTTLRPDRVLFFNTRGLQQALLAEVLSWPEALTALLLSDYALPGSLRNDPWSAFWRHAPRSRIKRLCKQQVGRMLRAAGWPSPLDLPLRLPLVFYTSRAVQSSARAEGLSGAREAVIHWGVDIRRFAVAPPRLPAGRFLFCGQLRADKGVHTLIEALGRLSSADVSGSHLSVVGGTRDPAYAEGLRARVTALGLQAHVTFHGHVAPEQLPALYAAHDTLVFTSEWAEPFSIALLEGMAAGLCVIGTRTGGSAELLEHGVNAWTLPPGDADRLAGAMHHVLHHPEEARVRAEAGQAHVREHHGIDAMARALLEAMEAPAAAAAAGEGAVP